MACVEACSFGALRTVGNNYSPEGLFAKLLLDLPYYKSSGGGVTFSGGEPTLYPKFIDQVLNFCHIDEIHTTLETCGTYSQKRWQPILGKFDLIYFDLKIIDETRHKSATGASNKQILANARDLVACGLNVEFRLPLVPGYTDDEENLAGVVALLEELGQTRLHLLSYHNMGETKIDIINGPQKKLGLSAYSPERLAHVREWLTDKGIEVLTED